MFWVEYVSGRYRYKCRLCKVKDVFFKYDFYFFVFHTKSAKKETRAHFVIAFPSWEWYWVI